MSKQTTLSSGTVNGANLVIELVEPTGHPSVVRWSGPPNRPSSRPTGFNAVAADLTRLIAAAATAYTQIKTQR